MQRTRDLLHVYSPILDITPANGCVLKMLLGGTNPNRKANRGDLVYERDDDAQAT